jgi:tetratricopeptide (TPR) repeat protein
MGGVGKTALAVNAARHFQESGGEILWAGLSATNGSVSPIVDEWLARLGCNPSEEPTSAIRATLAGRVDSGQGFFVCIDGARPEWSDVVSLLLLAIPAHVYVLVTATHAGLAQTLDLTPIHLDTVPTETAVQLLTNRAGRDEQPLDRAIVEAVGGLPLALVLAGRQLAIRSRRVGGQDGILLMQIRQQLTVLDAPGHPGLAAIFRIAYEGLSEEEQRAFRAVSVFASSQCDLPAAAALTATDVNVVEQLLDRLSDANLLNWGRDGWYTQHALLKIFGRSCISPVEHDRVRERHLAHFVAMSTMLAPDSPRSDTLMIDYLPEAVVAAEYAAEHGRGEAIRHILLSYWIDAGVLARKKMLREAERLLVAARSYAAANDDGEALSVYTGHLASVYLLRGRIDDAERRYREAIEASRSLRLHSDESAHRGNLGMLLSQTGRYEEAAREHSAALDLAIQSGNVESAVNQINCLAILRRREGMLREAANLYQVGLSLIHDKTIDAVELRTLEGTLLSNLGLLYADMGELDTAEQLIGSGLDIARKVGDVHHEANRLGHLGNIKLARGDVDGASALLSSAVELAVEMEIPALEGSWRMNLGTVRVLQGAIEEARSHYTRALTLAEAIGFRELMGQASANLGRLHEQAGEWDSARESYELSLSAYGSAGGSAAVTVRQWLNDLNRRHPSALS